MRVIIDMDETICDLLGPAIQIYNERLGKDLKREDIKVYGMDDYSYLHQIYKEPGFFLNLKPFSDAIIVIDAMIIFGHDVIIASDPQCMGSIASQKYEWLKNYLPMLPEQNIMLGSRKDILRGDMIFDDAPKYLTNFEGITVAMDRPYNRDIEVDYRVQNWPMFLDVILKERRL